MKRIDYKVKNGKLLRIAADIRAGVIRSVEITGDFFVHPEDALERLELFMQGLRLSELSEKLGAWTRANRIKLIGFHVNDLVTALEKL